MKKKLVLSKETLRGLDSSSFEGALGGAGSALAACRTYETDCWGTLNCPTFSCRSCITCANCNIT